MRGSIQKRGNGSWRLVFDLDRDHTGRRHQKVITFHGTKREADDEDEDPYVPRWSSNAGSSSRSARGRLWDDLE